MNNLYNIPLSAFVLLGMMISALLLWLLPAVKQRLSKKLGDSGWTRLEHTVAETQHKTESAQRPTYDPKNE